MTPQKSTAEEGLAIELMWYMPSKSISQASKDACQLGSSTDWTLSATKQVLAKGEHARKLLFEGSNTHDLGFKVNLVQEHNANKVHQWKVETVVPHPYYVICMAFWKLLFFTIACTVTWLFYKAIRQFQYEDLGVV